jgi:hypothetical protein
MKSSFSFSYRVLSYSLSKIDAKKVWENVAICSNRRCRPVGIIGQVNDSDCISIAFGVPMPLVLELLGTRRGPRPQPIDQIHFSFFIFHFVLSE